MTNLSDITISDDPEARRPGETRVECTMRMWNEHEARKNAKNEKNANGKNYG